MVKRMPCFQLSVFVPEKVLPDFVEAVSPHIPAFLGQYEDVCWWSAPGIEQYRERGQAQRQKEPSVRFECLLPHDEEALDHFIQSIIIPAHPWREPLITISKQEIVNHG